MSTVSTAIDRMAGLRALARYLMFKRQGLPGFILLTVWVATGCSDAVAPAAGALRVRPVVANDMQALPPVVVDLPYTPRATVFMASYPFREGVLVEGRITGLIHVTSDPGASAVHVNDDVDYKGVYDFSLSGQCDWSATIRTPLSNNPLPACQSAEPRYSKVQEWRDTILLGGLGSNGVVNAQRGGGSGDPQNCPTGNPCHVVSGSQTVAVTPLAADLDVRGFYSTQVGRTIFVPPFTHSSGYYTIAFRDSATPRSAKGMPMPFQAISWAWRKTDPLATPDPYWGSTDINQCPTQNLPFYTGNTCNLYVRESGVLTSVVRVNGIQHTDSVCVQCAADTSAYANTFLNQQRVRDSLIQLDLRSLPHNPPSERVERVLMIVESRWTHKVFTMPIPTTKADRCNSEWHAPTPLDLPDSVNVLAFVHVHPMYTDPDSARPQYICPNGKRAEGQGGSDPDWRAMRAINNSPAYQAAGWNVTFFVMASDYIYRMDPNRSPGSDQDPVMRWDTGLCAWASMPAN